MKLFYYSNQFRLISGNESPYFKSGTLAIEIQCLDVFCGDVDQIIQRAGHYVERLFQNKAIIEYTGKNCTTENQRRIINHVVFEATILPRDNAHNNVHEVEYASYRVTSITNI